MKPKGNNCYSISENELLHALSCGAVLWDGELGTYVKFRGRELHPRRDRVHQMIDSGRLVKSHPETELQRACGMATYKLAEAKP